MAFLCHLNAQVQQFEGLRIYLHFRSSRAARQVGYHRIRSKGIPASVGDLDLFQGQFANCAQLILTLTSEDQLEAGPHGLTGEAQGHGQKRCQGPK